MDWAALGSCMWENLAADGIDCGVWSIESGSGQSDDNCWGSNRSRKLQGPPPAGGNSQSHKQKVRVPSNPGSCHVVAIQSHQETCALPLSHIEDGHELGPQNPSKNPFPEGCFRTFPAGGRFSCTKGTTLERHDATPVRPARVAPVRTKQVLKHIRTCTHT